METATLFKERLNAKALEIEGSIDVYTVQEIEEVLLKPINTKLAELSASLGEMIGGDDDANKRVLEALKWEEVKKSISVRMKDLVDERIEEKTVDR